MTIKDMIEKRAKVWETAKNFVDTHENENGVLSAEDNATYSRMEQEIDRTCFQCLQGRLWCAS